MSGEQPLNADEFAAEVSRRLRIVPWRRVDQALFYGILLVALLDLVINLVIVVAYIT